MRKAYRISIFIPPQNLYALCIGYSLTHSTIQERWGRWWSRHTLTRTLQNHPEQDSRISHDSPVPSSPTMCCFLPLWKVPLHKSHWSKPSFL